MKCFSSPPPSRRVTSTRAGSYAPGEVRLDVASVGARLLLVRESWDAGWEARVDGERTPLYEAAGIFFAVPVPPGRHRVALSYRTPGFRIGLLVTGLWLAGSAIHAATRL